jgi:hypothetical protein
MLNLWLVAQSILPSSPFRFPYQAWINLEQQVEPPYSDYDNLIRSDAWHFLLTITYALGFVLSAIYSIHFLLAVIQSYDGGWRKEWMENLFVTSDVNGTSRLKKAATRRIHCMLHNAMQMHQIVAPEKKSMSVTQQLRLSRAAADPVFLNFLVNGEKEEAAGSFWWTWQQIRTGSLFDTEGVWLPTRLLVFQAGQIVCAVLLGYLALVSVERIADSADEAQASLGEDVPDWVYDFVPTGSQVRRSLYPAAYMASVIMVLLILIYIPRCVNGKCLIIRRSIQGVFFPYYEFLIIILLSTVSTILKYRCGQIPSLRSSNFLVFRISVDSVKFIRYCCYPFLPHNRLTH